MDFKRFAGFAVKVAVVHAVTYLVVGAAAYQLSTKEFYVGEDALFKTFMRSEDNADQWQHVMHWFLPAQLLRGFLMAAVLYPFFEVLRGWGWRKRFAAISGLYVGLGYWGATVAAPGTIEGMVYMVPSITMYHHLIVQPEIIVQGLWFGAWLGWWMARGGKVATV